MTMKHRVIAFIILLEVFFVVSAFGEEVKLQGGVPFGILNRVFLITLGTHSGTCFVVDIDKRQYLITARHVVEGIKDGDSIKIFQESEWKGVVVKPIFPENNRVDIVALAMDRIIAPKMTYQAEGGSIRIGQDVYFLGFPFGLATQFEQPTPTVIPFIKKGILSAIDGREKTAPILYIDGHNNPGFSGGPVIFANYDRNNALEIIGVISGYRLQPSRVLEVTEVSQKTDASSEKTTRFVLENTGIVIAHGFGEIIKAIRAKPIGLLLDNP